MKKTLTNLQMDNMLRQLAPLLTHRDKVGYIAARNYRVLSEAITEYSAFKNALIEKYGEPDENEDGQKVFFIKTTSPNFKQFCDELASFNEIEQEIELMIAKYEDAIGSLSGEELLGADWMFED